MTVKQELNKIRRQHGGVLNPSDVVEFARVNRKSALHSRFDWDDATAAHEHRLLQARHIIRVHIEVLDRGDGEAVEMRAFVRLPTEEGYIATKPALTNKETRREILLMQLDRLESVYTSHPLAELSGVKAAIDSVRAKLRLKRAPVIQASTPQRTGRALH
jgi:hypothetical protein